MKVFKEEQRFNQPLFWIIHLINLGLSVMFLYAIYQQLFLGEPFGDKPAGNVILVLLTLFMIAITVLFFSFKLTTRIDEIGLHYQFFPFHLSMKTKKWSEIEKAYVRKYNPISEYGGWGIKGGGLGSLFYNGNGKAINVSGNIGFQLEFKNEKKLLIGTQNKAEAIKVLETYKSRIH